MIKSSSVYLVASTIFAVLALFLAGCASETDGHTHLEIDNIVSRENDNAESPNEPSNHKHFTRK